MQVINTLHGTFRNLSRKVSQSELRTRDKDEKCRSDTALKCNREERKARAIQVKVSETGEQRIKALELDKISKTISLYQFNIRDTMSHMDIIVKLTIGICRHYDDSCNCALVSILREEKALREELDRTPEALSAARFEYHKLLSNYLVINYFSGNISFIPSLQYELQAKSDRLNKLLLTADDSGDKISTVQLKSIDHAPCSTRAPQESADREERHTREQYSMFVEESFRYVEVCNEKVNPTSFLGPTDPTTTLISPNSPWFSTTKRRRIYERNENIF